MASLSAGPPGPRRGSSSTQGSASSAHSPLPAGPCPAAKRGPTPTMVPTNRGKLALPPGRAAATPCGPSPRSSVSHDPISGTNYLPPAAAPAPVYLPEPASIIPTAIVIKNIPFSLPPEALTALVAELELPLPYAFNYHYDQGQFRGLAFANFHAAEDADQAVAALNGFDVAGRKLRAEHKRVLQLGEKERIEKVKALKRMQSLQRERHRRLHSGVSNYEPSTPTPPSSAGIAPPSPRTPEMASFSPPLPGWDRLPVPSGKPAGEELDLNDPLALDIYSRVLLFKDDRLRDELAFSKSLTSSERRMVRLAAQRLGLHHYSAGQGEERCAIVSKVEPVGQVRAPPLMRRHGEEDLARRARQHALLAYGAEALDAHARLTSMRSYNVLGRSAGGAAHHHTHRSMISPATLPMRDLSLGAYALPPRPPSDEPSPRRPFSTFAVDADTARRT